jgi:hypothetical protein
MITGWFSDSFLVWAGVNLLFLWSPVYNKYKDLINAFANKAIGQVSNVITLIDSKIPKYKD